MVSFWGAGVLKKGGDTSLVAQSTKNLPANAGDSGSIPGLGRFHNYRTCARGLMSHNC